VSKETQAGEGEPTSYGEVVQRLEEVVKRLEGGELSLEESLKAFEEGIGLVRRGEKLLSSAEKRIEQLLDDDGESKVVPLDLGAAGPGPAAGKSDSPQRPTPPAAAKRDDTPF
jgi:exodeoxyribonuclease VII small subunit